MPDPALITARTLADSGRARDAAAWFARVLAATPTNAEAAAGLARIRLAEGDLAGAVKAASSAAEADPTAAPMLAVHRMIGLALHHAWMLEEAAPWLERAARLEPWDATLRDFIAAGRPRPGIAPEAYDPHQGRALKRYPAREGDRYIYVIEITGTCNLRCPSCPVGNSPIGSSATGDRAVGFMDFALFERIIAKIKREAPGGAAMINLFNWGEPLLHPELPRIIAHLRAAGLKSHLSTNLNIRRGLEEAITANPDDMKISISGFTAATYSRTHKRGDIELVKRNMRELRRLIDKHKATTHVWVCQHLYRSNQSEAEAVRRFAAELGFPYHPIPAFYMPLERIQDVLHGRGNPNDDGIIADLLTSPVDRQRAIAGQRGGSYDCELRFNQTVINHDGTVALCCSVYDRGNMLGVNFLDENFAALEARKYNHPFCASCMADNLHYTRPELPKT